MKEDLFFLWVKALIMNKDWLYLMLQSTSKVSWIKNPWYWDLPWWRVDRWENVYATLYREVFEETRLWISDEIELISTWLTSLRVVHWSNDYWLLLRVYRCTLMSNNVVIVLSNEHVLYEWVNKDLLLERLSLFYPKEILENIY